MGRIRVTPLALLVVLGLVVSACTAGKTQTSAGSGSGNTLNVPLAPADPEAFRQAEATLRRDGRTQANIAQVGPGALKLAELMDRTASFALTQLYPKFHVQLPAAPLAVGSTTSTPGGHLAAPLIDLSPPGQAILGAYLLTTQAFDSMIEAGDSGRRTGGDNLPACPCTVTDVGKPFVDEVSVDGNPGLITTTMTATMTASGSKVSIDVTIRVAGEVRDPNGKLLYKIGNEGTGHADGDGCPDASGTAHANMLFGGHEEYFDSSGAKIGTGVDENFGGALGIRADDNAVLAGVDISPVGQRGDFMMRLAAQSAAPIFEKVWRSGVCITVVASPDGGPVDKDSQTTVTVKVMHAQEGGELDKLVEAKFNGTKSIEPNTEQKAPATFHYTAGSADGDKGSIVFESVSNRGIGRLSSTFTVGGDWTISSVGTSVETVAAAGSVNSTRISFTDVKVTRQKDFIPSGTGNVVRGSGTMTVTGSFDASFGDETCSAPIDRTIPVELVGSVSGTVLKLKVNAPTPASEMLDLTCSDGGNISIPQAGESNFYGFTLGEMVLPGDGGTQSFDRSAVVGIASVRATATVTVVRLKN